MCQFDEGRNGVGGVDFAGVRAAADENHAAAVWASLVPQIEGLAQHVTGAIVQDEQETSWQVRQLGVGDDGGIEFTHNPGEIRVDGSYGGQR